MSEEHPNATAYRRTANAFRSGDRMTLEALLDEEVIWHIPGDNSWAGDLRGRPAVLDFLGALPALGFRVSEHDVFGNDEHVCALSLMGARRPGVDVETRVVSVFHFRDGRQLERWLYPEDRTAWDRIFEVAQP